MQGTRVHPENRPISEKKHQHHVDVVSNNKFKVAKEPKARATLAPVLRLDGGRPGMLIHLDCTQ